MVKRRRAVAEDGPSFEVVPILNPARMVTLTDPNAAPTMAQGAFARLDPPVGYPEAETDAWRARVAEVALAVRVLPTRRDAEVPAEELRPRADRGEDVRVEACELALAKGGEPLVEMVDELFSEAEGGGV